MNKIKLLWKKISQAVIKGFKKTVEFVKNHKKVSAIAGGSFVVVMTLIIVLVAVLSHGGDVVIPTDNGGNPETPTGLELGEAVFETSINLDSNGGTVAVSNPDSLLNGLVITVPSDAYELEQTFEITSYEVKSHTFGSTFNPITPLIAVNNGNKYSSKPMTVDIPISISNTEFAMGFYYDEEHGTLEAIPTVDKDSDSITLGVKHFSEIIVSKVSIAELEGLVFNGDPNEIQVDSGFRPSVDDWQFYNYGSSLTQGGNCAGQSLTMMWYYSQVYLKDKENTPRLYNLYDNDEYFDTPNVWIDDSDAYRFASKIQLTQDFNTPEFAECMDYSLSDSRNAFYAFAYAIYVTNSPQFVAVFPDQGIGHAMIVYGVSNGELLIADPNFPGVQGRSITFDDQSGTFDPYCSGINANDPNSTYFSKIIFTADSALIDYSVIREEYEKMLEGTSGDDIFPETTLEVLTDYDQASQTETWSEGYEFNLGSAYNAKLSQANKDTAFIKFYSSNPNMALTFFKGANNERLFDDTAFCDGNGVFVTPVSLIEGVNDFGVLAEEVVYDEATDTYSLYYVHFLRVRINYTTQDAESTITFVSNGGSAVQSITGTVGSAVTSPSAPTRSGYDFTGWYSDKELTKPYTFGVMPSADITLYAGWQLTEPPVYNIVFNLNGGTFVEGGGALAQSVTKGQNAAAPLNPVKTGYAFIAWSPFLDLTDIQADALYVAQWEETFTITFDLDGGTLDSSEQSLLSQEIIKGGDAILCSLPTKNGFDFIGWSPLPDLENILADAAYTAEWEIVISGSPNLLYELMEDDTYCVSVGTETSTAKIFIMNEYAGKQVTKIKENGFANRDAIKYVYLPANIKTIGDNAFNECDGLKYVFYETQCHLQAIGDYAFYECGDLTNAPVPPSLLTIGDCAFYSCDSLCSLDSTKWSGQLTSIGIYAFANCANFTTGNLGKFFSLQTIGDGAFMGTAVYYVSLPASITDIGDGAFANCPDLASFAISMTPETHSYFSRHSALTYRLVSSGYKFYDECDYYNVVDSILFTDDVPDNCTDTDSGTLIAYPAAKSSTSYVIPSYVKTIGSAAFSGNALEQISMSRNMEKIEDFAFMGCNALKSICIPISVTEIEGYAFYNCNNLTIYVEAESKPDGWAADWNVDNRPVVWGCEMSEKDANVYLVSVPITASTFSNTAGAVLQPPARINTGSGVSARYDFYGWFTDDSFPDYAEVQNITSLASGATAYAAWTKPYATPTYTVTFDVKGGEFTSGAGAQVQNLKRYQPIVMPNDPTRQDREFQGWYYTLENIDGEFLADLNTYPVGDATYYAKWSAGQTYTISFNSMGGTAVASITGYAGQEIDAPSPPTRDGYAFSGWYIDSALTTPYYICIITDENLTLYAGWVEASNSAVGVYDLYKRGDEVYTDTDQSYEYNYIELKSDGTFVHAVHVDTYPDHTFTGTWVISGNVVTTTYDDNSPTKTYTYTVGGSDGTTIVSFSDEPYDIPFIYVKR